MAATAWWITSGTSDCHHVGRQHRRTPLMRRLAWQGELLVHVELASPGTGCMLHIERSLALGLLHQARIAADGAGAGGDNDNEQALSRVQTRATVDAAAIREAFGVSPCAGISVHQSFTLLLAPLAEEAAQPQPQARAQQQEEEEESGLNVEMAVQLRVAAVAADGKSVTLEVARCCVAALDGGATDGARLGTRGAHEVLQEMLLAELQQLQPRRRQRP